MYTTNRRTCEPTMTHLGLCSASISSTRVKSNTAARSTSAPSFSRVLLVAGSTSHMATRSTASPNSVRRRRSSDRSRLPTPIAHTVTFVSRGVWKLMSSVAATAAGAEVGDKATDDAAVAPAGAGTSTDASFPIAHPQQRQSDNTQRPSPLRNKTRKVHSHRTKSSCTDIHRTAFGHHAHDSAATAAPTPLTAWPACRRGLHSAPAGTAARSPAGRHQSAATLSIHPERNHSVPHCSTRAHTQIVHIRNRTAANADIIPKPENAPAT